MLRARGAGGLRQTRVRDFVALLLVAIDVESGECLFVNAGQVPPLILSGAGLGLAPPGEFRGDPPVGILSRVKHTCQSFHLGPEQTLVLLSDGIIEAMNPAGELLGLEGLQSAAPGTVDQEFERRHRMIFDIVDAHGQGTPPHDDATVVCVERHR